MAKKRGGWSDELCERMEEVREGSFGAVLMEKTLWVGQFGMRILSVWVWGSHGGILC